MSENEDNESERTEESKATAPRSRKKKSEAEEPWMVWKGEEGQHTPPLPSHDLGKGYVLVYITSMEEAEAFAKTGLWELHIPDGELRKTRPDMPDEG